MSASEQLNEITVDSLSQAIRSVGAGQTATSGLEKLARLVIDSGSDCAIWTGATAGQYHYSHVYVPALWKATGNGQVYGHRLVCGWRNGPAPTAKHQAAHSCGNTRCVNPRHLRWATPAENASDKVLHGTGSAGERNGMAKLTTDQVQTMRITRQTMGLTYKEIAALYGVSTMTAYRAVSGQSWKEAA